MQLDDFQKSAWVRGLIVSALDWEGHMLGSCPSSVSNSSFPLLYSLEAAGNWASAPPVRHGSGLKLLTLLGPAWPL